MTTPDRQRLTRDDPTGERAATFRTWRRYGLGAVVLVVLIILVGPRSQTGAPLDPRSTEPGGVRGVLDVLEELGVDIRIEDGTPTDADGVALLISDDLGDTQRDAVQTWVEQGGRLVLADPLSALGPDIVGSTSVAFTEPTIVPDCDDPFVAGVDRVAVAGALVFDLPDDASGCFPRNNGFFMLRIPTGEGERIILGGQATLTNQLLGTEDTAVLLVNLLTPDTGETLHVIEPDDGAADGQSLVDVLPNQVGLALLQIPLAWLALVWWRARRHGLPVPEEVPVKIEAAETTVAVGNLLSTAGRAAEAAALIRSDVHRQLSRRLGISRDTDAETFARVVADRTDISPQVISALLLQTLPTDDAGLVRYANLAGHTMGRITRPRDPRPALSPDTTTTK